jgi:hypothetical protein
VALTHFGLVLVTTAAVLSGYRMETDWPMAWTVFVVLDFPVSFLLSLSESTRSMFPSHVQLVSGYSPVNDVWNFLVPVPFFAFVGSAWWFLLVRWAQHWRAGRATGV